MPDESPTSNNEPEGSKDGRQWTSAEIFAFPGFLNDERNEGALQPAEHYHEDLRQGLQQLRLQQQLSSRMRLNWERRVVSYLQDLCGNLLVMNSLAFLRVGAMNFVVGILQRSLNSFVVQESWKGEDLGTGPLTTIFGAFG
ncbi:hypothetical protein E4U13_001039 [Claviceps humidiphila]|uniref:Uncharacterized protein n=1 Tax=Claviceps humidiphila TaxID=1294629 RepID=A0A9P7Q222_9HYPO|nr:hypothetical protein E4U13_001039 [Claviceps humidiphila]